MPSAISPTPLRELSDSRSARSPAHPVEQFARREIERTGELDERVHAGDPFATLQLTDGRSVEGGADSQLFLGELGPFTTTGQVGSEPGGDIDHWLSPPPSWSSKPCRASCSSHGPLVLVALINDSGQVPDHVAYVVVGDDHQLVQRREQPAVGGVFAMQSLRVKLAGEFLQLVADAVAGLPEDAAKEPLLNKKGDSFSPPFGQGF